MSRRRKGVTDLAMMRVQGGLCADDAFHISQLYIIRDRTDTPLNDFASRLRDGAYDPESLECIFPFRFAIVEFDRLRELEKVIRK